MNEAKPSALKNKRSKFRCKCKSLVIVTDETATNYQSVRGVFRLELRGKLRIPELVCTECGEPSKQIGGK